MIDPRVRYLAAVLGLLVVAGCGSSTVDTGQIESGIKSQVTAAGHTVSKVDCPSGVKSQTGGTFQCAITLENGSTGKVKVTQLGHKKFQYELVPGSVQVPGSVVEKSIVQALDQKGAPGASVNCPDNIIVKLDTYFVCEVTAKSGHQGKVKFTFSDASGTVDESSVNTA